MTATAMNTEQYVKTCNETAAFNRAEGNVKEAVMWELLAMIAPAFNDAVNHAREHAGDNEPDQMLALAVGHAFASSLLPQIDESLAMTWAIIRVQDIAAALISSTKTFLEPAPTRSEAH